MTKNILILAAILFCFISTQKAYAQSNSHINGTARTSSTSLTETQKIEHLIANLRNMKGAVFIRNGSEHTAQEAADHLNSKWQKYRSKIKTAEEFIKHLATKSSMTGDLYMIRFPDGKTAPTAEVLQNKLSQIEAGTGN
jgi:peptidoglycan hydrolase CwlO-like protein